MIAGPLMVIDVETWPNGIPSNSRSMSASDEIATPDAITVNPMLGMDTLEPFVKTAGELGKGLFVLVRTSNPGSAEL